MCKKLLYSTTDHPQEAALHHPEEAVQHLLAAQVLVPYLSCYAAYNFGNVGAGVLIPPFAYVLAVFFGGGGCVYVMAAMYQRLAAHVPYPVDASD